MKITEVINKILKEAHLQDQSNASIVKWIIQNRGKEDLSLYLSAVEEENLQTVTVEGRGDKEIPVKQLEHSNFFVILANSYASLGWFNEALGLFEAMVARGSNESTVLNDYGATLLNQMMTVKIIDKEKLDVARKLIFEAFKFDKEVSKDFYAYPAYRNLCYLRDIEAIRYYNQNEDFTAFVLSWMSIEMTILRIWFQFIKNRMPDVSKEKVDKLMRWDIEPIVETLFLGQVDGSFKEIKRDLDTLRGIRNDLLHGKIDNPTHGNAKLCIDVAYRIIPILQ
jgi:pentatricopeptide repeat protein